MINDKTTRLNLKYYKGSDSYSDGDVENDILSITQENDDFSDILKNDNRWAVLYHLTPLRRNLLEWYDFNKNANLLEIGAGCGALTGLFCEKVNHVTAVELSKRRAEIIVNRTKQYDNLEIIVGNLNDIKFEKKFDYITLIGVLEYAGRFTKSDDPYADFIDKVKQLLTPNGTLIIAIENKFGLKYWNGAKEDHTGKLFDSIEGYVDDTGIRTFGKPELEELLKDQNFANIDFYYPMPDYKIPTQIFTDLFTPQYGQMANFSTFYDQERTMLFDEKAAFANIIKNNLFGIFANSFLVFAQNYESGIKKIYSNFQRSRDQKFLTQTSVVCANGDFFSTKKALNYASKQHLERIYNNYSFLKDKLAHLPNVHVAKCELIEEGIKFEYINGYGMQSVIEDIILQQDKARLIDYFEEYIKFLTMIYQPIQDDFNSSTIAELFGHVQLQQVLCTKDYANFDLIFDNIIHMNNSLYIIDYEWVLHEKLPINYLVARNIYNLYYKYGERLKKIITQDDLFLKLRICEQEKIVYSQMEESFLNFVYSNGKSAKTEQSMNNYNKLISKIKNKAKNFFRNR